MVVGQLVSAATPLSSLPLGRPYQPRIFRNTPFGEPVARGIYNVSRHPQIVMSSVVLMGGGIAIGSWSALLMLLVERALGADGAVPAELAAAAGAREKLDVN